VTGSRNEDVRDLSACNAMLQCHIQPSHMPVGPEDWQNITKVLWFREHTKLLVCR